MYIHHQIIVEQHLSSKSWVNYEHITNLNILAARSDEPNFCPISTADRGGGCKAGTAKQGFIHRAQSAHEMIGPANCRPSRNPL